MEDYYYHHNACQSINSITKEEAFVIELKKLSSIVINLNSAIFSMQIIKNYEHVKNDKKIAEYLKQITVALDNQNESLKQILKHISS